MLYVETTGSLPTKFYEVQKDGSEVEKPDYPLAKLLSGKVNRYQTPSEFWETITLQLRVHGNAYCLKQYSGSASERKLIGLLPLLSSQMEVQLETDGSVSYRYNDGQKQTIFGEDQIWHVKLPGNGVIGMSPLSYARNSIGIGIAADNRMGKIFSNGAKPAGILSTGDNVLSEDQRAKVKNNFREMTEGSEDTLFVLEAGFTYSQISLSPKDVELLDSRRFQVEDIARFMGAPSVLINDGSAQTAWGTGIGQIVRGWYQIKFRPHLERIESSVDIHLIPIADRGRIRMAFDFDALLRSDMELRFKAYKEAVTGGFMSPDEARAKEGWGKKDGGAELYMQQQMVPLRLLATGAGLKSSSPPKGAINEPS